MKAAKSLTAAAVLTLLASGSAFAYHDGGVAYCDGCHTMHNSSGNKAMGTGSNATQLKGVTYLLQGSDQSSTCLNCHATTSAKAGSYHIMTTDAAAGGTVPSNYTPGGDFAWVKETFNYNSHGTPTTSLGERHGHNVVAADFGITPDSTLSTAPGGNYPAANLACSSCHDPHGKYRIVDASGTVQRPVVAGTGYNGANDVAVSLPINGSGSYGAAPTTTEAVGVYRLLGGPGYLPDSVAGVAGIQPFAALPPYAVAPATYNRSEASTDTRVAYGTGMSEWCANCHTNIHNSTANYDGGTSLIHPASSDSTLGANILANYNAYVSSGNFGGTVAGAYTSMVPFEEGTNNRANLALHSVNDGSQKGGADSNSNVMCLSCHRAHASGWDSMTRWTNKTEFLTVAGAYPGTDSTNTSAQSYGLGRTMNEVQATFYQRPATVYATYQRSLCNKCHAKD
ncbi:cytochrome C [Geomonas edaphica]|uniref:cytochrome C n=1 Tax=Geomonas edaphica TaxID=2570226 RepID=UPI0010A84684|nr:cytochrome C [Geomonas edaphica]